MINVVSISYQSRLMLKFQARYIPSSMKKYTLIQKTLHTIKPALFSTLFMAWITSAQAQTQTDIELCNNFSRIGKENTELRDSGKSREQVISYNNLYISDIMNKNTIYQDYLTSQVELIFSADYLKLNPAQVQAKLYNNCIDIFKRAEQSKPN